MLGLLQRVARRCLLGGLQRAVDHHAERQGIPPSPHAGGHYDAFSHAYVSARLTIRLGWRIARMLGALNERLGSEAAGNRLEAEMDHRNNAVGRQIGRRLSRAGDRSAEASAAAIRGALVGGELWILGHGAVGARELESSRPDLLDGPPPR